MTKPKSKPNTLALVQPEDWSCQQVACTPSGAAGALLAVQALHHRGDVSLTLAEVRAELRHHGVLLLTQHQDKHVQVELHDTTGVALTLDGPPVAKGNWSRARRHALECLLGFAPGQPSDLALTEMVTTLQDTVDSLGGDPGPELPAIGADDDPDEDPDDDDDEWE